MQVDAAISEAEQHFGPVDLIAPCAGVFLDDGRASIPSNIV